MALEDKTLPQRYREINFEEYNFLKRDKSRDNLSKLLLIVLAAACMLSYIINIYSKTLKAYPYGDTAIMVLIASLSAAGLILLFIIIMLFSKTKRLNNGEHLYYIKKDPIKFKVVGNFSDASVSVSDTLATANEELDENGNPVFYAEELYDDEEDFHYRSTIYTSQERKRTYLF